MHDNQLEKLIDKLEEIRCGIIDVENAVEKKAEATNNPNVGVSNSSVLLNAIPANWCDPLLTGDGKALTGKVGEWGCEDIENLINGIRSRLEKKILELGI